MRPSAALSRPRACASTFSVHRYMSTAPRRCASTSSGTSCIASSDGAAYSTVIRGATDSPARITLDTSCAAVVMPVPPTIM